MSRLVTVLALVLPIATLAACGDDSGSPAAPSSTASVSVTVASPVRMGQTAQATGTETRSNGQTQAVTTGWQSDAPGVASVTTGGLVTGVANGRATIYVVASGRQGQQVVRVVPDYQGRWIGGLRVTSCAETGVFAETDFCDAFPVGETFGHSLNLSQTGEQLTATASYGPEVAFAPANAPIREDGSVAFSTSGNYTEGGIVLSLTPSFTINSPRVSELTGTATDVWRFPNINGEGRLAFEFVRTTRTGTATSSRGNNSMRSFIRKLSARERHKAY